MKTPLEKLQARWQKQTGESMPEAIARLPIGRVLTAVEWTEDGQTVFVPAAESVSECRDGFGCGDSMREWDGDNFY